MPDAPLIPTIICLTIKQPRRSTPFRLYQSRGKNSLDWPAANAEFGGRSCAGFCIGGKPFFRVLVETEKAWLGHSAASLPILPGMGATVDIHTGTRTVLDYFLRPVLKLKAEAFRER